MFSRWSRAATYLYRVGPQKDVVIRRDFCSLLGRGYSKVASTAEVPFAVDSGEKGHANTPEVCIQNQQFLFGENLWIEKFNFGVFCFVNLLN